LNREIALKKSIAHRRLVTLRASELSRPAHTLFVTDCRGMSFALEPLDIGSIKLLSRRGRFTRSERTHESDPQFGTAATTSGAMVYDPKKGEDKTVKGAAVA